MKIPSILAAPGPLQPDQVAALESILKTLTPEQSAWLCGYFAGLNAAGGNGAVAAAASSATAGQGTGATILFGSQTGNAEKLARKLRDKARAKGLPVTLVSMADYKPAGLKKETNLLVLVSTHGEGDPPDTAVPFHQFLFSKRAPKLEASTRFAVLALGDTSYEHFCKTGADIDARLGELGAQRILPRVDCDLDYEAPSSAWMDAVLAELAKSVAAAAPVAGAVASAPAASSFYDRKSPFAATMLEKIQLNGRGSAKETYHYEISLECSGLTYLPGDALGVIPRNTPDVVSAFIAAAKIDPATPVETHAGTVPFSEACARLYEITLLTRPVFKAYAELTQHERLLALLKEDKRTELSAFLYGRQVLDLLLDFPSKAVTAPVLAGMLRKMNPRLYSIASSLRANPDEVHITVGVTRYTAHGRNRKGVCSCFMADAVNPGDTLDVFIETNNNFRLPSDGAKDVIMVGPGTGIAPFRAFVAEREQTGATGRNWLFFGDQHFTTDFLYQAEWQQALKTGSLHRLDVAFSRDQADKVYVQHRMRERGKDLWEWLQNGAHFYVCGDANRMAKDVDAELLQIAATHGGRSADQASEWLAELRSQKRYQRDVY